MVKLRMKKVQLRRNSKVTVTMVSINFKECNKKLKDDENSLYCESSMAWGITKQRMSASCGHLRTVIQTLQIKGFKT